LRGEPQAGTLRPLHDHLPAGSRLHP
jgi:hypothetical protein